MNQLEIRAIARSTDRVSPARFVYIRREDAPEGAEKAAPARSANKDLCSCGFPGGLVRFVQSVFASLERSRAFEYIQIH